MTNVERTGRRSLAANEWHRHQFPDDHAASDLDLYGRCIHVDCRQPLYLIEATETTLDFDVAAGMKQTWWNEQHAYRLGTPVVLMVYRHVDDVVVDLRAWRCVLAPRRNSECSRRVLIGDSERLVAYLHRVRRAHNAVLHDDPGRPPWVAQ